MHLNINATNTHKQTSDRFIELDVLRGFAILFMIFLHVLWDLNYFGLMPLDRDIYQFQKIVPTLFLILVGICLVVSSNKRQYKTSEDRWIYEKHLIYRGFKIFSLGMVLTSISMLVMPSRPVVFGILHCIGISIILSVPFLRIKHKIYNLLFGTFVILSGMIVDKVVVVYPTFFHLLFGFHQVDVWRYTIDYFPILPWFGVTLIGIALGDVLYRDNKRRFHMPDISKYKPAGLFSWMGQHSLMIYLVHQPVIAGALSIYLLVPFK